MISADPQETAPFEVAHHAMWVMPRAMARGELQHWTPSNEREAWRRFDLAGLGGERRR
jgi:hypothetical protein